MYYESPRPKDTQTPHFSQAYPNPGALTNFEIAESIPRYPLRDYQQSLIQQVFSHWCRGEKRLLLQLPTGAGKTVIFTSIILEFVLKNEPVLVLVHRQELLSQARATIEAMTGLPVGVIKAGYPVTPLPLVQVASIQTLTRRKPWPKAALVIVDEAHHSCAESYQKVFRGYAGAYVLGVTATPARIDGQGFKHTYGALILGPSVRELIDAKYLSQFKLFAAQNPIRTKGLRTVAGDFNQKQLAQQASSALVMGDIVATWRKHALGKKTVCFCVNVAHSKAIAAAYQDADISCEHLDGATPDGERQAILSRFRTGETQVLANCGIVSEGYDLADIEAVQCVRPTQSLGLWLQMVGRALRPHPGKQQALILDHTLNWLNHGLPDEVHPWSLEPISLESRKWALECPACSHVFKPLPHEQKSLFATCPNCQAWMQFEVSKTGEPPPPRLITQDEAVEVQEVRTEADPLLIAELHRLRDWQESSGHKVSWIYYRFIEEFGTVIQLPELRECAKLLGYKPGWAWHRWKELLQEKVIGGAQS